MSRHAEPAPVLLPPGVDAARFRAALDAFRAAVGAEWVLTAGEDLDLYRDAYSPFWGEAAERRASAAVAPASVEEVQAVMRAAHHHGIPIYPISTGRNLGYGGSAPNLSGSVVLDLKRMNRILEVDDRRHFAIVEPGVSYFEMHRHLAGHGYQVWLDVPGPGWGSLVGNALDHGVGDTWGLYRSHFSAHCGMEVVLADGTLLRTGMGALPGAKTWGEYPLGYGPSVDGLFAQGNFGVVTKMGFWLMPAPEHYLTGTITAPRRADIVPLIDLVNLLEHQGIGGEPLYGSPLRGESGHADYLRMTAAGRFPDAAELDAFAAARGRPWWSVKLQFYGPPEVVRAQWAAARRLAAGRIAGAGFVDEREIALPISPAELETVDPIAFGVPSLRTFALTARSPRNPQGSDGHLFFSPVIPKSGEALLEFQRVMWNAFTELGLPPQVGPFTTPNTWIFHGFVCVVVFLVSRTEPARNAAVRAAFERLIGVAAEHGWGEYRTGPAFQDAVRATYSFNDHALLRLQEKLKDAVDPKGILAAGRYGLWPAAMRRRPP